MILNYKRLLGLFGIGAVIVLLGLQVPVSGKVVEETEGARIFRYNPEMVAMDLIETRLFFGLSRREGDSFVVITSEEWESFLKDTVSLYFESFTVYDAVGNFRGSREDTKILMLLHEGGADEGKIRAIATAYVKRFEQEGVLRIDR